MKGIGILTLNGKDYPVLVNGTRYGRRLKLAKGGKPRIITVSLDDEQIHINKNHHLAERLLAGETIYC